MKIAAYCICGSALSGTVKPDAKGQKLLDEYWRRHSGDGHAPCDSRTAARARARDEEELAAMDMSDAECGGDDFRSVTGFDGQPPAS